MVPFSMAFSDPLYTSLFAQKEQHKKTNNKKAATNNKALTQL